MCECRELPLLSRCYSFRLPSTRPPRLRTSRIDDEIFEHTLKEFPELAENDYEKLIKLDEEWMKSEEGKKRWRNFMQQ